MSHGLGWKPDLPDHRDFVYGMGAVSLPPSMDLRSLCPPVYDQGDLGSCTANAVSAAVEVALKKESKPEFMPSRLFIYRHSRVLEGTVGLDAGATLRDAIKTVATKGAPHEDLWPYDIEKFRIDPPASVWGDAVRHIALQYASVAQSLTLMKSRLATSLPFVIGISVYDSFMNSTSGRMPMPEQSETLQGGHAVLVVGYDDASGTFLFRNSWGADWGMEGYGTLPYAYLLDNNLSDDFWAISLVK